MPAEYWEQAKPKSRQQLEIERIEKVSGVLDLLGLGSVVDFRGSMKEQDLGGALKSAGEFGLGNLDLPIGPLLGVLSPVLRRTWGQKARVASWGTGKNVSDFEKSRVLPLYTELALAIKNKAPEDLPDDPRELRKVLEQALELEGEGKVLTKPVEVGLRNVEPREKGKISKADTLPEKLRIPRVTYHGTGDEFVSGGGWFDDSLLGKSTGAVSARMGHFTSGLPETTDAYVPMYNLEEMAKHDRPIIDSEKMFEMRSVSASLSPERRQEIAEKIMKLIEKEADRDIIELENAFPPDSLYRKDMIHAAKRRKKRAFNLANEYINNPVRTPLRLAQPVADEIMGAPFKVIEQPAVIPTYVERGKGGTYTYHGHSYGNYGNKLPYSAVINDRFKKGADTVLLHDTYDGGPLDDVIVAKKGEQLISALSPDERGKKKLISTLLDSFLQLEERKAMREGLMEASKR